MQNFWDISHGAKILLALSIIVVLIEGVYINHVMGGGITAVFAKGTSCERILEKWLSAHPNDAKDKEIYRGDIATVDFDGSPLKQAKDFKTAINESVAQGANFAGTFALAQWGCGTGCQNHAIVNVATGKIITLGPLSEAGVGISPESTILIVNPKENFPTTAELQKASFETLLSLAQLARVYFVLEGEGDKARLQKICAENPFEGVSL